VLAVANLEAYVPRYLSPEEAGALYTDALKQAEAAEANAYINYLRAVRAREALEEDIRRLNPVEPVPCRDEAGLRETHSAPLDGARGYASPEQSNGSAGIRE
jgi:hypothetical protein